MPILIRSTVKSRRIGRHSKHFNAGHSCVLKLKSLHALSRSLPAVFFCLARCSEGWKSSPTGNNWRVFHIARSIIVALSKAMLWNTLHQSKLNLPLMEPPIFPKCLSLTHQRADGNLPYHRISTWQKAISASLQYGTPVNQTISCLQMRELNVDSLGDKLWWPQVFSGTLCAFCQKWLWPTAPRKSLDLTNNIGASANLRALQQVQGQCLWAAGNNNSSSGSSRGKSGQRIREVRK